MDSADEEEHSSTNAARPRLFRVLNYTYYLNYVFL